MRVRLFGLNDERTHPGKAFIAIPDGSEDEIFYNPIQEFNRDMSIAAINCWLDSKAEVEKKEKGDGKGVRVLEALSATGLRAMRYAKECPLVDVIVANDMDSNAVESIKRHIGLNGVAGRVESRVGDA
ncbi:RNA methyltransferase tRNA(m5U54)methyltransferase, partial [Dinochytrium kinnereticum]